MANQNLDKNYLAAIRQVLAAAQSVDRNWQKEGHALRWQELSHVLSLCQYHSHPEVRKLDSLVNHLSPESSQSHFLGILIPLERTYSKSVTDSDFLPIQGDSAKKKQQDIPSIVGILDNCRSAHNVGSILRSAECFGFEKIFLSGYTATPDNSKVAKSAMGTENFLEWEYHKNTINLIEQLKREQYCVYALEYCMQSISLYDVRFSKGEKIAIAVGNERHGLPPHILKACQKIIHIPMLGRKNSLNVGMAFACMSSEIRRQQRFSQ